MGGFFVQPAFMTQLIKYAWEFYYLMMYTNICCIWFHFIEIVHGLIHWLSLPSFDKQSCHTKVNTLRPRQNGRRFADVTFKRIFFNENVRISIKISLKFVRKGPIDNNPTLVQIMAWRRSGDKPLSEPMMFSLPTHICVTRPQWVKRGTIHNVGWCIYLYLWCIADH